MIFGQFLYLLLLKLRGELVWSLWFIFEYTMGMIMMKNTSTFSMGRALILRIYGRHLQKPAGVIIFYFNKLVHHIGGLLSLVFCSEREAAIESAGVWHPR